MSTDKAESTWRFFARYYPVEAAIIMGLLVLAGLVESVGAVSILPLLGSLVTGDASSNPLIERVYSVFQRVGLQPSLGMMLMVLSVSMFGKGVLTYLAYRKIGYVEAEVAARLRLQFLDKLLNARWTFFSSQPTGRLTHALTSEMAEAGAALGVLARTLSFAIQALVYFVVAAYVSWQVLICGIFGGLVLGYLFKGLISYVRKAGNRRANSLNQMTALFTDSLVGAKPLKIMNLADGYSSYVKKMVEAINTATKHHVSGVGLLTSMQEPCTIVLLSMGMYVSVTQLEMSGTSVLALAFFFQRILTRISSVQQSYQQYAGYEGALRSLLGKMSTVESNQEISGGGAEACFKDAIRFENVSIQYGNKFVVSERSLKIPMGKITAFRGESGSGKTTAVDAVAGLVKLSAGDITIDRVSLAEVDIAAWRSKIGYVPQEVFLFHDTIRSNVVMGRDVDDAKVWRSLSRAGAKAFVERLPDGLDSIVGEHGRALSGGQRQRLMIARALYSSPKLLILDEATSGLDADTEKEILQTLSSLRSSMAIIVVSHQEQLNAIADEVYEFSS